MRMHACGATRCTLGGLTRRRSLLARPLARTDIQLRFAMNNL